MITLNCPHCSQPLQIPEEYAGQSGRCKHCQQSISVPRLAGDLLVGSPTAAAPVGVSRSGMLMPLAIGVLVVVLAIGAFLFINGGSSTEPTPESPVTKAQGTIPEPAAKRAANSPKDRLKQVEKLAVAGNYEDAVKAFEAVRAEHPAAIESIDGLNVAVLYLQLGDRTGHEALCRWMFEHFPGNKKTVDAERTAKAYVIHPDANDAALLAEAAARIDYFLQKEESGLVQWGRVSQGIAAYRQKRYDEASALLEKEIKNEVLVLQSLSLVYSAMTEYAMGNEEKGLDRLADARVAITKLPQPSMKAYAQSWSNVLTAKLALDEAEGLMKPSAVTPTDVAQPQPESPKTQREHALQLAREGKYQQAVDAIESVRTTNPALITSHDAVLFGIVYTLLEDQAQHEAFSRWVLDRFSETTDPFDAEHAAKAYLIYPGAHDEALLAKSVTLAQIGVDNTDPKHKGRAWIYLSQAMAKYRDGAHEDASTWLQKTIDNTDIPNIRALALAYAALNAYSMGDAAKAADTLQQAKTMAEKIPKDAWEHQHHFNIVFGEAEATLGGTPE